MNVPGGSVTFVKGLIFGENAQLQVNGSFLGSTAERITLQDEFQFGSNSAPGLLTVSQPVGLQLGNAQTGAMAAPIVLAGQGNQLSSGDVNDSPFLVGDRDYRFAVPTGKTLARDRSTVFLAPNHRKNRSDDDSEKQDWGH